MREGRLEVTVERDLCLGSHACARRAPSTFSSDADGKAVAAHPPGDPDEAVLAAARGCPAFAIRVSRAGEDLV